MPLAPLTDADRERLRAEGLAAWAILRRSWPLIALAFASPGRTALGPLLLSLAGDVARCFATRENAELALRELQATGALSWFQATALRLLVALHHDQAPRLDPDDPSTWWLGAPPLTVEADGTVHLQQTPQEPQP